MKFSYEWLQDLIKFKEKPEKLAELLTLYFAETTLNYQNKRAILDIDLSANRFADGSSHLGVSREIGAILKKKFNYPKIKIKEGKEKVESVVKINNQSKNCRLYSSRVIVDLKVKPSPLWLQERLIDCGLRPINNVVDATNYIMLLTGQPLHAFDFDKVASNKQNKKEIVIREAKEKETITTLDGKTYSLSNNALLICDINEPLAIAGIKGGLKAEVTEDTKRVILESANFEPTNIRKTSREINLKTDASIRFEHNLPLELAPYALDLVAQLIQEIAGGTILKGSLISNKVKQKKLTFTITEKECQKFLGFPISFKEIKEILDLLGFAIKKQSAQDKVLIVELPSFRNDITIKEDVMGEIGRLKQFNQIKPSPLEAELKIPTRNEIWEFTNQLTDLVKSFGFVEVKNYSFISLKDKKNYLEPEKIIDLLNPISDSFFSIRPNLLINLFHNIELNYRFYDKIKIFEIGNAYLWENDEIQEKILLGGIWAQKEREQEEEIFYQVKGIIEALFESLNIKEKDYEIQKIKNGLEIVLKKDKSQVIGSILYLDKEEKDKYSLEGSIVAFEFNILLLKSLKNSIYYQELPQYPSALRDISFLIDKKLLIGEIIKNIKDASNLLESLELFDIYEGKNIPNNKKSLSFHLVFRAKDRTLSSEEIDEEMTKITIILKQLGAEIR